MFIRSAHSPNVIDAFAEFIKLAAEELEVDFGGFSDPLIHQDKWRVNKANTNFGKHKMEYAARSYKKVTYIDTCNKYVKMVSNML